MKINITGNLPRCTLHTCSRQLVDTTGDSVVNTTPYRAIKKAVPRGDLGSGVQAASCGEAVARTPYIHNLLDFSALLVLSCPVIGVMHCRAHAPFPLPGFYILRTHAVSLLPFVPSPESSPSEYIPYSVVSIVRLRTG